MSAIANQFFYKYVPNGKYKDRKKWFSKYIPLFMESILILKRRK
jgi:hypothetical protein